MKDFRRLLNAAVMERDHPWGLATLVRTAGSSYRQPGTRMLIYPGGRRTIGFLSGGCLEEEIARESDAVMRTGVPRTLVYDTQKLFGCEGRLFIFLERVPRAGQEGNFLTDVADRVARRALCRIVVPYAEGGASALLPDNALVVEKEGVLTQTLAAPPRLIAFGNGPEVEPLAGFAGGLGWEFFNYAHPDDLPAGFKGDATTAAVVMTHKFGRDMAVLDKLLPLGLPYVGLLGPRKRHQELLRRFADFRGGDLPQEWLGNLHAPAGLDTGSESPEEIAFSIVGEAAAVLAGRKGGFLKTKNHAIHQMEACA